MRHGAAAHPILIHALGATLATAAAASAGAQLTGLPVVQSPFPGRVVIVAVNGGQSGEFDTISGAVLLSPASQRLSVTLGLGGTRIGGETFVAAGGRVAYHVPLGATGRYGVAPFVGVGGIRADSVELPGVGPPEGEPLRTSYSFVNVPIGASIGIRLPVGVTRAVSLHVAPSWQLWRFIASGIGDRSNSYWRFAVGGDFSVTERIGFSAAFETGHRAESGELGPRDNYWGAGLSYVFR